MQSLRDSDAASSCVVTVAGLKKSGKTTVAEALISGLKARGYRVGSVKSAMDAMRFLDPAGTDTRRHADAGADVVVALLGGESVRFERGSPPASPRDIMGLFPPRTHFIVCEGSLGREPDPPVVLCLRSAGDLEETLSVRAIRREIVVAICGFAASGARAFAVIEGIPVLDVADPVQRDALLDRIVQASEGASPCIRE